MLEEILAKEEEHAEDMKTLIENVSQFEKQYEKQKDSSAPPTIPTRKASAV